MYAIALLALTACDPTAEPDDTAAEATCLTTYSAENGYGFDSDMWHQPSSPSISEIEDQCAAEGHDCTDLITVTRDAAACIAEEYGLDPGLEGYQIDLIYNHTYNLPIWSVSTILTQAGHSSSGESLALSAVDGAVLGLSNWNAQP